MHRAALLVVALLGFTSAASAQVLYGSIVGNVTDSTGGVVPQATVVVKQPATGFSRQTLSNETGQFQFPAVPGGVYEVSVNKTGFTNFSIQERPGSIRFEVRGS